MTIRILRINWKSPLRQDKYQTSETNMAVVALFRDVFINKQEIVLWKFENGEADATNQFQKGARFITRKVFSNNK